MALLGSRTPSAIPLGIGTRSARDIQQLANVRDNAFGRGVLAACHALQRPEIDAEHASERG